MNPVRSLRFVAVDRAKFKQFCQEQAIPPWWRAALTVLEHDGVPVCLLGVSVLRGADDIPYVGDIARFFSTLVAIPIARSN